MISLSQQFKENATVCDNPQPHMTHHIVKQFQDLKLEVTPSAIFTRFGTRNFHLCGSYKILCVDINSDQVRR